MHRNVELTITVTTITFMTITKAKAPVVFRCVELVEEDGVYLYTNSSPWFVDGVIL